MVVLVAPQHEGISPFHGQGHALAHGQHHLGSDMAERQAGQHPRLDPRLQPLHHHAQFEAPVMRHRLVVGELAKNDGLLLGQHPGMQQLGQHALDAVGVLSGVLNEQHAALEGWQRRQIGGADQRGQHGEVAPP